MALQSSGAISIDDIVAEFGGSAPDGLTEYYRGGTYVPDTGANSGVPTSGAISLEDFYGASAVTIVAAFDQSIYNAEDSTPSLSLASISFNTDGTITVSGTDASPTSGTWATGGTVTGGDYEIRATLSSGSTPTGPSMGTWNALSTIRTWSMAVSGSSSDGCTLAITLRDTATQTTQDTCTVNITVDSTGGGGL